MKKLNSKRQFMLHIIIYFIEILFFTSIIIMLVEGWDFKNGSLIDIIKQYVFAYTLYQLIIIAIFKFKDSLEIDSLTTIKSLIDKFQIYAEMNIEIPESEVEKVIEKLLKNTKVTMNKKQKNSIENLLQLVTNYKKGNLKKDYFRFILKQESRDIDVQLKIFSFHWMNSIFLRMLK